MFQIILIAALVSFILYPEWYDRKNRNSNVRGICNPTMQKANFRRRYYDNEICFTE